MKSKTKGDENNSTTTQPNPFKAKGAKERENSGGPFKRKRRGGQRRQGEARRDERRTTPQAITRRKTATESGNRRSERERESEEPQREKRTGQRPPRRKKGIKCHHGGGVFIETRPPRQNQGKPRPACVCLPLRIRGSQAEKGRKVFT